MNSQISSIVIGLLWGLVTSIQTSAQHLNDRNFGISEQGGRGQQENVPSVGDTRAAQCPREVTNCNTDD